MPPNLYPPNPPSSVLLCLNCIGFGKPLFLDFNSMNLLHVYLLSCDNSDTRYYTPSKNQLSNNSLEKLNIQGIINGIIRRLGVHEKVIQQIEITLPEYPRGFHLVTDEIVKSLGKLPREGILHLFIKHTSAGLTINENDDPTVREDFANSFDQLVKEREPFYKHTIEGADDMPAHIKASLVGFSVSIPITNHRLNLGIWQGIYLCEFRNRGGQRHLMATLYS